MPVELTPADHASIRNMVRRGGALAVLKRVALEWEISSNVASAKGDVVGAKALGREANAVREAINAIRALRS